MTEVRASSPRLRRRRYRTIRETLGSIIVGFELLAIFLCALVFFGLRILPAPVALGGGAVVLALAIGLIGVLRFEWGVRAGWAFHILLLATGLLHGGMFFVAGVFLALWAFAMIKGGAIDRERAVVIAEYERALAAGEIHADGTPRSAPAT